MTNQPQSPDPQPNSGGVNIGDVQGNIENSIIAGRDVNITHQHTHAAPIEIPSPPDPTPPPELGEFVGRQDELTYFVHHLKDDHLVVISGMPGAGKTAMAVTLAEIWQVWHMNPGVTTDSDSDLTHPNQVEQQENTSQHKTFWHTLHQDEGLVSVIRQLAGFLAWHGQTDLWRMLLSAELSGGQLPPANALIDYVLKSLIGQGFLLCFDDVHHMHDDPLLSQFIDRLQPLLQSGELSLILTSREIPDYVRSVSFTALGGLTEADVGRIVASRDIALPDDQITLLYTQTEGNAELLMLAINVLKQARNPARTLERLSEEADVERYLLEEVDEGLQDEEREVMIAIAILLGYPGTRDAVETVSERRRLKRVLSELSDRLLLTRQEQEPEDGYTSHAIVREFYYDFPSRRELQTLHRLAGEYYDEVERDVLRAALHYERAGDFDQAAELATADVRLIINQGQIRVLQQLLGRFNVTQLSREHWILVNLALAKTYDWLGDQEVALSKAQEAQVNVEVEPIAVDLAPMRAQTYGVLGLLLITEDAPQALEWIERGLAIVKDSTEIAIRTELLVLAINANIRLGKYSEALHIGQMLEALLPMGASQLRLDLLVDRGLILYNQGQLDLALNVWQEALEISNVLNDYFQTIQLQNNLAMTKFNLGDWDAAIIDHEQALALANQVGNKLQTARLRSNLGFQYLIIGDDEVAQEHLLASLELARASNLSEIEINSQFNLADLNLRQGNPALAEPYLVAARQLLAKTGLIAYQAECQRLLAQLALVQQDEQSALTFAQESVAVAVEMDMSYEQGLSQRVLGQALLANGQTEAALDAFTQSLLLLNDAPYETARTQLIWGQYLLTTLNSMEGYTLLAEAQATFKRLGAKRELAHVETLLG